MFSLVIPLTSNSASRRELQNTRQHPCPARTPGSFDKSFPKAAPDNPSPNPLLHNGPFPLPNLYACYMDRILCSASQARLHACTVRMFDMQLSCGWIAQSCCWQAPLFMFQDIGPWDRKYWMKDAKWSRRRSFGLRSVRILSVNFQFLSFLEFCHAKAKVDSHDPPPVPSLFPPFFRPRPLSRPKMGTGSHRHHCPCCCCHYCRRPCRVQHQTPTQKYSNRTLVLDWT